MDGRDFGAQLSSEVGRAKGGDLKELPNSSIPDDLEEPEDFDDGSDPEMAYQSGAGQDIDELYEGDEGDGDSKGSE